MKSEIYIGISLYIFPMGSMYVQSNTVIDSPLHTICVFVPKDIHMIYVFLHFEIAVEDVSIYKESVSMLEWIKSLKQIHYAFICKVECSSVGIEVNIDITSYNPTEQHDDWYFCNDSMVSSCCFWPHWLVMRWDTMHGLCGNTHWPARHYTLINTTLWAAVKYMCGPINWE